MARLGISVTIITLNEEKNVRRAIMSALWADEVVVIDSGSTDRTVEIAKSLGAQVEVRPWQGYGPQKNYAQSVAKGPWVLSLDADEEIPEGLAHEIREAVKGAEHDPTRGPRGFWIPRKTWYLGRWIMHGGWYPSAMVRLARKDSSRWTTPEVHERLEVTGPVSWLASPIHHFTFVDITDQVQTNLRYSRLGNRELRKNGAGPSFFKMLLKPVGKFLETYVVKLGILDGIPGLIISINAAHSIFLKYAYFYEDQPKETSHAHPHRR